ncbi:unnamed protein product, partial [Phaeothamnion confervicola]
MAIALNNHENHRTDTAYEDALIAKTFLFQFVNSYASLFYIAFIKTSVGAGECLVTCMSELSTNLGTIFLTRLVVGNLTEVLVPVMAARSKEKAERKGVDKDAVREGEKYLGRGRDWRGSWKEFVKHPYDVMLGTFGDFCELLIQFGYSTLFVAAYPLSCLMAFVSNYIELRVDAWKLLQQVCRRPEPRSAEDIGTWYAILETMSAIAVVTNSALIAFTSDLFDDQPMNVRVWIFVVFEHAMFAFKFLLATVIPDVPQDVDIQIRRNEFLVSKV